MNKWFLPKQKEVEFSNTYQGRFTSGDSKNFVQAGASGIICDLSYHTGQKSVRWEKCGVSEVVVQMVEELPKNQNTQLFMDNWFSTLRLLSEPKTMIILSIATFCSNCMGGCPLMSKKDLKKHGCGSLESQIDYNTGIHLLKWFDNKRVIVGSSFAVECTSTAKK